MTDDLREDGTNIDRLMAERSAESTRAIQEVFETDFLATAGGYYAANTGAKLINGFNHIIVADGANQAFELSALIKMKLAFDKANVPLAGRVFICDPIVEAALNGLVTITHDVTDFGKQILEGGFARDHNFLMNLYGWNIITSNRLPRGNFNDGTTSITGGVANIFMSVLDDQTKPIMGAWRRHPKVEGERNKDRARDEFVTRCRYGFGIQRLDTLGVYVTSETAISN